MLIWAQPNYVDGISDSVRSDPGKTVGNIMGSVAVYGIFFLYCAYKMIRAHYDAKPLRRSIRVGSVVRTYGLVGSSIAHPIQSASD
jgi:hypothetical protein